MLELFDKICLDPRHHHPETIISINSDARMFKQWDMGLVRGDALNSNAAYGLENIVRASARTVLVGSKYLKNDECSIQ